MNSPEGRCSLLNPGFYLINLTNVDSINYSVGAERIAFPED